MSWLKASYFLDHRCTPYGSDRSPIVDDRNHIAERLERLSDVTRTALETRLSVVATDLSRLVYRGGAEALTADEIDAADRKYDDSELLGLTPSVNMDLEDVPDDELAEMHDAYSEIMTDWIDNLPDQCGEPADLRENFVHRECRPDAGYFSSDQGDWDFGPHEKATSEHGEDFEWDFGSHEKASDEHDEDVDSNASDDSGFEGSVNGYESCDNGETSGYESRGTDQDEAFDDHGYESHGTDESHVETGAGYFVEFDNDEAFESGDDAHVTGTFEHDHVDTGEHDSRPWLDDGQDQFDALDVDDAHHDPGPWQSDADYDYGACDFDEAHHDPGPDLLDNDNNTSNNSFDDLDYDSYDDF